MGGSSYDCGRGSGLHVNVGHSGFGCGHGLYVNVGRSGCACGQC